MRLSRAVVSLMTLLLLVAGAAIPAIAEDLRAEDLPRVAVTIDGVPLNADAYIVNGRTVVPLRAIFEALGATVEWDAATRTVTATKGTRVIKLTIDQTTAYVDGKPTLLAVPGMIINSRSFVPLRFVDQALDAGVSFDTPTRTVLVVTNAGCTLAGGQKHTGTIKPGGETWGLCGSPPIVTGAFAVAGADNPVLTIEAGALVQFEARGSIEVGTSTGPGGLMIKGTTEPNPVKGSWVGIQFLRNTGSASKLAGVVVNWAGGVRDDTAAVGADGHVRVGIDKSLVMNSA